MAQHPNAAPLPQPPSTHPRDTLRQALLNLESAQATGRPWAIADAQRTLAGCYRRWGAGPAAQALLEQALRWTRLEGAHDSEVDLLCELVELLAELAEAQEIEQPGSGRPLRDRARDRVFEATRLAARVSDARWEVTVLLRLSDVLDRFGDRDDATQLQVRALQLTVGASQELQRPTAGDAALIRRH